MSPKAMFPVLRRLKRIHHDEKVMNYNEQAVYVDSSDSSEESVVETTPNVMIIMNMAVSDEKVMKRGPKLMTSTPRLIDNAVDWHAIFRTLGQCTNFNELKREVLKTCNQKTFSSSATHLEMGPQNEIDFVAENFYPHDGPRNVFPIQIYGDGNCFPRALSKLMTGTEDNHLEMCFRIILGGIRNEEELIDSWKLCCGCKQINDKLSMQYVMYLGINYTGCQDMTQEDIRNVFQQELFKIRKPGTFMGI